MIFFRDPIDVFPSDSEITIDVFPSDSINSMEPIAAVQASQPDSTSAARPWSDLPPGLLLDVSGRLHDAVDFIRFHAVCMSWLDGQHAPATRPKFLPWLLLQRDGQIVHSPVIYSRCADVVLPSAAASTGDVDMNWVTRADGLDIWLFTGSPNPRLFDPVTGTTARRLPPFPDDVDDDVIQRRMRNPHGVVYNDGTIFLYNYFSNLSRNLNGNVSFMAAVLHPGDTAWAIVEKKLNLPASHYSCAAYHDGKVLVWAIIYW